jgi:hypothetical protein
MTQVPTSFGKADPTEAQKFYERLMAGDRWQPKDGMNRVRVMPPWALNIKQWWYEWTLHWNVGPKRVVVPCLLKHGGTRCAACEEVDRFQQQGAKLGDSDITPAQWGAAFNLVDLLHPDVGAQSYRSGIQIMRELMKFDVHPDYGDITDPARGFDITISRGPKGAQPLYTLNAARNPSPLANQDWLVNLPDLSRAFVIFTYEEQQAILKGEDVLSRFTQEKARGQVQAQPAAQAQPAPTSVEPQTLPILISGRQPRCFGKEFAATDPMCAACAFGVHCKVACNPTPQAQPVTTQPTPRCFRRMYDQKSPECLKCEFKVQCGWPA